MELKSGEIFRREIFLMADGKCLGYADELLLETVGNPPGPPGPAAVKALVVKGRRRFFGLFGREPDTLIPWEEIAVIGEDAVFVKGVPTPPPEKPKPPPEK